MVVQVPKMNSTTTGLSDSISFLKGTLAPSWFTRTTSGIT